MSPITQTARLEAATETLAEYIGYLSSEIYAEESKQDPNLDRIAALTHELDSVADERRAITPDNQPLIDRAIYVYGPLLKPMHVG